MKYQFCIRFDNIDANSAASKAVLDCNKIFSRHGYRDYTFTVGDNKKKLPYYANLIRELTRFFLSVKPNSIVGIQYPLLSINNVFKYFMRLAKLKNVIFFCVVHDLESLRTGGKNAEQIQLEIENLNFYDTIIVHNESMLNWLKEHGVKKNMIPLELFDYLCDDFPVSKDINSNGNIVYAGNLGKSDFVYSLAGAISKHFNLYGPNFKVNSFTNSGNLNWIGEFNPNQIPKELKGSFGLIWDGKHIEKCDDILGNYLLYNNPHKCSLYIAAGLPVIAPANSAIGKFITQHGIGILIDSLLDLENIKMDDNSYHRMKENIILIRENVINGYYFGEALKAIEKEC